MTVLKPKVKKKRCKNMADKLGLGWPHEKPTKRKGPEIAADQPDRIEL